MKRFQPKSECPIRFTLNSIGNSSSLLIARDIVFYGKHTYGEFLASDEKLTTSMLAAQLVHMEKEGVLTKTQSIADKRKNIYNLTEKGLDLIPLLVELANWGVTYNDKTIANEAWLQQVRTDRNSLITLIRQTVKRGGCVFYGENSVITQLQRSSIESTR